MKSCPFCGSEAHVTHSPRGVRVECVNRNEKDSDGNPLCPVNMRTHHHNTEAEAIAAWDTRK